MGDIYASDYYDSLTRLPNLKHLRILAKKIMQSEIMLKNGLAFVYLNIENFKSFNAYYGLEAGDHFLQVVAQDLQATFQGQIIARLEDDHFIVITEYQGLNRKLAEVVQDVQMFRRDLDMKLKAGVYMPQDAQEDSMLACDRAKIACDSIKYTPNAHIAYYDEKMHRQLELERYVVKHIDEAIAGHYIRPYYQPLVRVLTGKACSFEVLSRWEDPKLGTLNPWQFVNLLEKHHLIHKLDLYVLRAFCEDFTARRKSGLPLFPVSINLSPLNFQLTNIVKEVHTCLSGYGIDPAYVNIEIAESALGNDLGIIRGSIERLRSMGHKVWLDNFGTGSKTLINLSKYRFDALKVDQFFLTKTEPGSKQEAILGYIISLAKHMGIRTISENVETPQELELLRRLGCEKAQGYLFGRPVPIEEVNNLKLEFETPEEAAYQDKIGKIDWLRPDWPEGNESSTHPGVRSLALVEMEDGKVKYSLITPSYQSFLRSIGIESDKEAADALADGHNSFRAQLLQLLSSAYLSKRTETLERLEGKHQCTYHVRFLTSLKQKKSFLLFAMNLTRQTKTNIHDFRKVIKYESIDEPPEVRRKFDV